jgi:rhodanese-related sulfurtransferase
MRTQRSLMVLAVSTLSISIAGCGSADPADAGSAGSAGQATVTAKSPAVAGLVTPQQAAELAVDPAVTVIDVRTPEEFAAGHLAGATMVDFYAADFADQIGALDRSQPYLVYCRSGNRSGQATALMAELGFEHVADLDGGVVAWSGAGLPLES